MTDIILWPVPRFADPKDILLGDPTVGQPLPPTVQVLPTVSIRRSVSLLTHIGVALTLALSPIPFSKKDWPNPLGPKGVVGFGWTQRNPSIAPYAFKQTDWPNPRGPARSIDLLTHTQRNPSIAPYAFKQTDWPNPRGPARVVQDQVSSGIGLSAVAPAFTQTDWRNPLGPLAASVGWTQRNPSLEPYAFVQADWPVPPGYKRNTDLTWLQSGNALQDSFVAPPPTYQTDWPNPRGAKPTDGYTQRNQFLDPYAFTQTDWPNPRGPKAADVSWSQTSQFLTPYAFTQTNWPNPTRATVRNQDFQAPILLTLQPILPPFFQTNWPTHRGPQGYQRSVDSLTWTQNGFVLFSIQPFNRKDWPNPQTPRRLDGLSWQHVHVLPKTVGAPFKQIHWPNPEQPRPRNNDYKFVSSTPTTITPVTIFTFSKGYIIW